MQILISKDVYIHLPNSFIMFKRECHSNLIVFARVDAEIYQESVMRP